MTVKSKTKNKPKRATKDERRAAVANLLEKYGGLIYGLALRLSGDPDVAEDIVQETFLQAHRKFEQFRGDAKPSTWLYTIAVRKYFRMQRKRSGEPARIPSLDELLPMGDRLVPDLPGRGETPLEAAVQKEALKELEAAILELHADYRVPLVLKEIAGFSIAEVSNIMGIKEPTVKTRLHRARNMVFESVSNALPQKKVPPTAYTQRVCMDLLLAKQESLDKGVDFPLPPGEFCRRCKAVFDTMDFTKDLCSKLANNELPASARQAVLLDLAGNL